MPLVSLKSLSSSNNLKGWHLYRAWKSWIDRFPRDECVINNHRIMHVFWICKQINFQVLSLHYIHSSYTFFPPKRQVIRAKRTDKLLFTSLLIFRNGLLEIFKKLFLKIKKLINRSSSVLLAPITCLLGGKKIDN